jgi:SAM-dependent methyltransferase
MSLDPVNLDLIKEIDLLWEPVYPYLAQAVTEYYPGREGTLLEIGPFSGVIFELKKQGIGDSFVIAAFPPGLVSTFQEQAKRHLASPVDVIETDPALDGVDENSVDLAIFRGAFFFPSLFQVNWTAIHRVLKPNGKALVGGGFGKFTPREVITKIGKTSKDLNLQMGKVDRTAEDLKEEIRRISVEATFEIITEGGLWVLMRKRSHSSCGV